jgi:phytoene dehydrogenase-like protein
MNVDLLQSAAPPPVPSQPEPVQAPGPPDAHHFDAIVIGSGMGGLTAANVLARRQGWRVLVLEQHFKLGGLTHVFRRHGRFEFDVGLHYVGEMEPGSPGRTILDRLTDGRLHWQRMPEEFERFVYPGLDFRVPSHPREYERRLAARFPAEAPAIRRYLHDVRRAARGYVLAHMADALPGWLRGLYRRLVGGAVRLAAMTTASYLERAFRDASLRALLASQWPDYGLPPSESLFGVHALIVQHYLRGAWYPVGGAKAIAEGLLPAIEQAGGRVLASRKVTGIVLEGGRACGVRVERTYLPERGEEVFRAPVIISDAGAANTYLSLLPPDAAPPFAEALARQAPGYSAVTLYLGLRDSPARLGIAGENLWIYESTDHERAVAADGLGSFVYLSFPSMKNPQSHGHTAEAVALARYETFEAWKAQPWKHREAAYRQLKADISRRILERIEACVPGLGALVEFQELSTPLTMELFQQSPRGAFYGTAARPGRLFAPWTHARSHVQGLYLTGQDVMSLGILGAMMGGLKCAGVLEGPFGFFRLMGALRRRARPPRATSLP